MATNEGAEDSLRERVAQRLPVMPPAERRVAEYLRDNAQSIIFATAEGIGAATGTSDATVVRTAKTLGYSGLPHLKRGIGRQMVDATRPSVRLNQRIESAGQETDTLIDHVFSEATERLTETHRLIPEAEFVAAVDLLAGARTVAAFGIGPSELGARFLALKLNRLGLQARSVGATGFRLADELLGLRGDDVVVLYAPSRLTSDTSVLLDHANSVGAATILVSDSLGPTLADRVTVSLPAVQSATGFTAEVYSALLVTDCLVLALASRDRDQATTASELLNSLRTALAPDTERVRNSAARRRAEEGQEAPEGQEAQEGQEASAASEEGLS
jgi:DNA-binding MurR/RpiR family transcriptional regulator